MSSKKSKKEERDAIAKYIAAGGKVKKLSRDRRGDESRPATKADWTCPVHGVAVKPIKKRDGSVYMGCPEYKECRHHIFRNAAGQWRTPKR